MISLHSSTIILNVFEFRDLLEPQITHINILIEPQIEKAIILRARISITHSFEKIFIFWTAKQLSEYGSFFNVHSCYDNGHEIRGKSHKYLSLLHV